MRSIGMRFTAIGLSTLVWALPAWAQSTRPPDRAPLTRSDDDADFDSADAPDNGDAPMAHRPPPRQGRPVQNQSQSEYHDGSYYLKRCPSYCLNWDGRPMMGGGSPSCPAECSRQ
jgi:hypothetical protein